MLLQQKVARVRDIHQIARSLDPKVGEPVLGRGSHSSPESRRIEFLPHTIILLHPGRRIKKGWANGHTIREVIEFEDGCLVLEVHRFGKPVMQANLTSPDEVEIYRYEPGLWEIDLGFSPNGDTIPILPNLFVDERDTHFLAWLAKNPRPAHGRIVRP